MSTVIEAEWRRVLVEWNETGEPYPDGASLPELLDQQVRATPGSVAVSFQGSSFSYQELQARASRLAARLRREGVRPEVPVAVCLERGPDAVVAFWAILQAGGAYLPLDPLAPRERLEWILADARAGCMLTQTSLAERLSSVELPRLCIDALAEDLSREQEGAPLEPPPKPEQLAYIIYTSGSTGRPKGVLVPHRGACNLAAAQRRIFGLGPGDRVLQYASSSFDASVWDFLMAHLSGAALHLTPPEAVPPGPKLLRVLRDERITMVTLPPSVLESLPEERLPELATLVSAGEACSREMVARWGAGRTFVNAYGPTEVTVCASLERASGGEARPSVGRPIQNTRVYVLDAELRPVAPELEGELYVAGPGVTRGYLGRADLTAERFVPEPFSGTPGARMYRTGDRVRWTADGRLDFLGRVDRQLKLRGIRIEPGEIEEVLRARAGARQAVVVIQEGLSKEPRLVAYLVMEDARRLSVRELRLLLLRHLPVALIPSAFVVLDALPLTLSGKVDLAALPMPEAEGITPEASAVPASELEARITDIWREALKAPDVGHQDNFFDLGGHSVSAMQVVSAIRRELGVRVPITLLFEAPVLEELARAVEVLRQQGGGGGRRVERVERGEGLPLSYAQERLWFVHTHMPEQRSSYNITWTLRLLGKGFSLEALKEAFRGLVARHETLRTRFVVPPGGKEAVQLIGEAWEVELLVREVKAGQVEAVVSELSRGTFSLETGRLVKAAVLRVTEEEHVLVSTLHHIITDGWSFGVMLEELRHLYAVAARGEGGALAPLRVQYGDYAVWQRGQPLAEHLAYWKGKLEGYEDGLELPYDAPRTASRAWRAATVRHRYPSGLAEKLARCSREQQATLFMSLVAGLGVVLSRYTGRQDVCVGTT
ncbi:amino acid adenylation domain-containing protein, partial [Corallococcus sp. CA054B]|uniref:non-ribosomal peptide synthetase n=1 Tax=Corallococcus sp. CA054B TaxID=2316734 RepID=UPI000EA0409A